MSNLVAAWFGAQFGQLHPLLQALHRRGGVLRGEIDIDVGTGLGGVIGKRLARSLGIPIDLPRRGFEVDIRHTAEALLWNRRFDHGATMRSSFVPVGRWPEGYWIERTGAICLDLTVDVIDGGWYWRPLRARWRGVPVPLWVLPRTRAGKRIEGDRYAFFVAFTVPGLGTVLRYSGALSAQFDDPAKEAEA